MRDIISLILTYIRMNRQRILISSLGLILGLACITQILVYSDSYRENLLYRHLEEEGTLHTDIEVRFETAPYGGTPLPFPMDLLADFQDEISEIIQQRGMSDWIGSIQPWLTLHLFSIIDIEGIEEQNARSYLMLSTSSLQDLVKSLSIGNFPTNFTGDVISVYKQEISSKYKITPNAFRDFPANNATINVTGGLFLSSSESDASEIIARSNLPVPFRFLEEAIFENDRIIFLADPQFLSVINSFNQTFGQFFDRPSLIASVSLNTKKIDAFEIRKSLDIIREIAWNLNYYLSSWNRIGYGEITIEIPILERLEGLEDDFKVIQLNLAAFTVPILIIAILLVNFSAGISFRPQRRQVALLKSRGASSIQVFWLAVGEFLSITITSLIIGIMSGLALSSLILRSDGFLSFSGGGVPLEIRSESLLLVFWIGIGVSLFSNIYNMQSQVNLSILEGHGHSERPPLWKRYYIDFLFLISGIIGYKLIYDALKEGNISETFLPILIFGALSPVVLICGVILVFSRFLSIGIQKFGKILWDSFGNYYSFVLYALRYRRSIVSKVGALIAVTIIFAGISTVVAHTTTSLINERTQYKVGADLSLIGVGPEYNATYIDLLKEIPGVQDISYYAKYSIFIGGFWCQFLGVNSSNFASTGHFRANYANQPLKTILSNIGKNESSIYCQKKTLETLRIGIGSSYAFYTGETPLIATIRGTFDYWPNFITKTALNKTNSIYFISNIPFIRRIASSISETVMLNIYVHLKSGASSATVSHFIAETFGIRPLSAEELANQQQEGVFGDVLFGALNADILVSLAIALVVILFYSFDIRNDRKREVSLLRSLGMPQKKIFAVLMTEILVVAAAGICFGLFISLLLSVMFVSLITFTDTIPPFRVVYPLESLLILGVAIFAISILIGFVAPLLAVREDTIEIRGE